MLQIRVVNDGKTDTVGYESWLEELTNALRFVWHNMPENEDPLNVEGLRPINKTLNEDFDEYGRLIQMVGTDKSFGLNNTGTVTYSRAYMDPIDQSDEMPEEGETQVWDVYNTTGDTHPIHFHLVNVKIIGRAPFPPVASDGTVTFEQDRLRAPDRNERGWKETVRMNPGEVTRVAMRFDLPKMPNAINGRFPVKIPKSPRTGGYEYVWHCHILEHEEHDMMRPLIVTPK